MRRNAFTLIELLVVISIIAILAAMLLPAISLVKQAAHSAGCASNQRQLMMAVIAYVEEQSGELPYSYGPIGTGTGHVRYHHTDRLGQYLEIESNGSTGALSSISGSSKVLRCAANTQSPNSISYGLNRIFCGDRTVGAASTASSVISRLRRSSEIVITTDNSGDARMYFYDPIILFGNGDVTMVPAWAPAYVQFTLPVPRHRKGSVLGFLDGHVRWSPNLKIEAAAKTVRPYDIF